jgi:hypothetical protein
MRHDERENQSGGDAVESPGPGLARALARTADHTISWLGDLPTRFDAARAVEPSSLRAALGNYGCRATIIPGLHGFGALSTLDVYGLFIVPVAAVTLV